MNTGNPRNRRMERLIDKYAQQLGVSKGEAVIVLAERAGYANGKSIYSLMNGARQTARPARMRIIARELGTTIDYLFGG